MSSLGLPDFDAMALDYETYAEPFTRQFAEAALALAGGVAAGERIIDIAAGTGALTLAAAAAGAEVSAIDFAPGMVARLAERLAAAGYATSSARAMDGQQLDLPDAGFDAAFSIFGVMLFPDWQGGLRELVRVLRPGGRAIVATWQDSRGAGPALALVRAYRTLFPEASIEPPAPGLAVLDDPGRLREAMLAAGLRDVVVRSVTRSFYAPSADWLANNSARLFERFPLYAALDTERRQTIADIMRRQLVDYETEDGLRIPGTANIAIGVR